MFERAEIIVNMSQTVGNFFYHALSTKILINPDGLAVCNLGDFRGKCPLPGPSFVGFFLARARVVVTFSNPS
jgi:hypothetical protein